MSIHKIIGEYLQKSGDTIRHYQVTMYGEIVREQVYSILEFQDKWGPESEPCLHILSRQDRLQLSVLSR